jgi:hypothetical protein
LGIGGIEKQKEKRGRDQRAISIIDREHVHVNFHRMSPAFIAFDNASPTSSGCPVDDDDESVERCEILNDSMGSSCNQRQQGDQNKTEMVVRRKERRKQELRTSVWIGFLMIF